MGTHRPADGLGSSYDKSPAIRVSAEHRAWRGDAVWERLRRALGENDPATMAIDTYPGVDLPELLAELERAFPDALLLDVEALAARPREQIDALIDANLTDDRVFGVMSHHTLPDFYDADRLAEVARTVDAATGPVIVVGWGAALVPITFSTIVLADLARWEIQQRQRAGAPNWRAGNEDDDALRKVKRGFFVDWRVADRHKRDLFDEIDFVLDTNRSAADARLITADTFHAALDQAVTAPFRVVPFFDPGVWGGQWMKNVLGLEGESNYAWCFDCVPEENSLLIDVDGEIVEIPAIDLVFRHPRELLGERTFARFGAEFPIRFDFLDTMEGGNLSLQVHPLTDYIQNTFGMHYTQDESYYLLDAADDAVVYLGLKTGIDRQRMLDDLATAATGAADFPTDDYVNSFPAKKHDHFLIPAGTVHCSGADSMVLEISATPYIFTFKMWDWGRVGLDGVPRPIHLDHAAANIQWDRDTEWSRRELVDRVETVAEGPGWREERTGLHELEFIEVRRHWFTDVVPHDTHGTVNVLNLVEGAEAIVESPTGAFEPWVVHYAETFIVPASVGPYTIRPWGRGEGQTLATVKASVRGT
ncbi:mannose-6-phosphate isomerase class I [Diaminobutyricimonas aerilata]|uniref:Mannose-6-phosphate isomerase class I n=1 Tax=Diaminobutyricimonas aerilata TaxID=1162967 RepID=A0A2M9CHF7_9MICO|nr:class I mannose-6-phosphate isomerase [Diaminobutyricimonas aerilata]PJJ71351.1 mannose-6-phosphate isomerase class I [Diaminobutyricimonas aerilata]